MAYTIVEEAISFMPVAVLEVDMSQVALAAAHVIMAEVADVIMVVQDIMPAATTATMEVAPDITAAIVATEVMVMVDGALDWDWA